MAYGDLIAREDVKDLKSFCMYAKQRTGLPYPTGKEYGQVGKQAQLLFDQYPWVTWNDLCGLVDWAKAKKFRTHSSAALVSTWRYAYRDGYLPALSRDPVAERIAELIDAALGCETDSQWRGRLMLAQEADRVASYREWVEHRGHIFGFEG